MCESDTTTGSSKQTSGYELITFLKTVLWTVYVVADYPTSLFVCAMTERSGGPDHDPAVQQGLNLAPINLPVSAAHPSNVVSYLKQNNSLQNRHSVFVVHKPKKNISCLFFHSLSFNKCLWLTILLAFVCVQTDLKIS